MTNLEHLDTILTKLNPAVNASFKSDYHAACLEGTRTGILETLMKWVMVSGGQPIFWLSGIAGTGKSTIAQTLCERSQKNGLLSASFFCSRLSEDLRKVERIVPTLAYFLAQGCKEYYNEITFALEADPTLAIQGIRRHFDSMLWHPLQNINMDQRDWRFILVIDGLDECEDRDATQNILSVLKDMPNQLYEHIRVFISCRPEYYIQQEFARTSNKHLFKLHDMERETVQTDIQFYLKKSLDGISTDILPPLQKKQINCLSMPLLKCNTSRVPRGQSCRN